MSELIIIGMMIGIIVGAFIAKDARKRGMNEIGWFIGVFLALIVFLPLYLIVRKPLLSRVIEQEQLQSGDARKCPFCAELIKTEALVCRFCGRELEDTVGIARNPRLVGRLESSLFVCSTCGQEIRNSHGICVHCAAKL
jgi:hypothetical protein